MTNKVPIALAAGFGLVSGILVCMLISMTSDLVVSTYDAGAFDANNYDTHWVDPGIQCLERETRAAQEKTWKLYEQIAGLEAQQAALEESCRKYGHCGDAGVWR